jgi:GT2 family glycosyltransferase
MQWSAEAVDERVIRLQDAVDVLAQVHAAGTDVRQHGLERRDLLVGLVPAIVDQHVDLRHFNAESSPECRVRLVPDEDRGPVAFVGATIRLDVDAVHAAALTEVVAPHFEASTAVDPDLHDVYLTTDEPCEVALINLEVVTPLPDAGSRQVGIEVLLEGARMPLTARSVRRGDAAPEAVAADDIAGVERGETQRTTDCARTRQDVCRVAPRHDRYGAAVVRLTLGLCIISHARPAEVREAVASAKAEDFDEIVVLDSASDPPLVGLPGARTVRSEFNLGCGGGRNGLAAECDCDILVFLDDDAIVRRGVAASLRQAFSEDPGLGAVAMRIERSDGTVQAIEQPFRLGCPVPKSSADCTYFIGAGFAVRRDAYRAIGGSDERLFYGSDDIDLAFRLQHGGWRIRYEPGAVVEHRPSPRGRMRSAEMTAHHFGNRVIVARTYLPWPIAAVHVLAWIGLTGREALGTRDLGTWWHGLGRGLRERVERRPLPVRELLRIHRLGGRILY